MSDVPRCSSFVDEPLPGTAATETGWLCIEAAGGWSRDVLKGDTFDPATSAAIREFAQRNALRVLLIRRPGRVPPPSGRAVFIASSVPGRSRLRRFTVMDYADIPALDPEGGDVAGPVALVCAHGKRDVCCAVGGRPVAAALAGCYADPVVWECSHTGGHRFAPVLIVLPTGYTYGRVTGESAKAVFDAARAGYVVPDSLRGRSSTSAAGQVAEVAVRGVLGPAPVEALAVAADGDRARVTHVDGRAWDVTVASERLSPRPPSCGKTDKAAKAWRVTDMRAVQR
ncbi:sucrase ferredoxin [Tsukamurella sp. 8F]|uniref:sucrase ferredoxin n=1 Tax=unclassified Tsukamurella TaxID=2633480 RepID=UPI0023B8A253|nr:MULTISPECIES: sucrase ferredoxin [unclassified Tsukamurella]MDF0531841.1 sucrase ferredoxin [Tsukamurella sp. 8J]MDF0589081.1 sucrase ferredoxin [Tsukamurella sp. 8F]